jgi:hypothetical protein
LIIRPFKRTEAVKLLTNALAYLGFHFNDNIISLILAKTNYFPGLIQLYCQKLLEAMQNSDYAGYEEISTPLYGVSRSHFQKVLSDPEFIRQINDKLEMTLFVEESGRSFYHAIALLVAFLCITNPAKGYSVEDICRLAKEYDMSRISSLKKEQVEELMNEMWSLNIFTSESGLFNFSTDGFRNLLGEQKDILEALQAYVKEGDYRDQ